MLGINASRIEKIKVLAFLWLVACASLSGKPLRVASLSLSTDEILLDMDLPKEKYTLVLLTQLSNSDVYANTPPNDAPKFTGQIEQVVAAKPDVVFLASYNRPSVQDYLKKHRIKRLKLSRFGSLKDIKENIQLVAKQLNYKQGYHRFTKWFKTPTCKIKKNLSALSYSQNLVFLGEKSIIGDVFKQLGLHSVATMNGVKKFGKISEEKLLSNPPEVVIFPEAKKNRMEGVWAKIQPKYKITIPARILSSVNHYAFLNFKFICDKLPKKAVQ